MRFSILLVPVALAGSLAHAEDEPKEVQAKTFIIDGFEYAADQRALVFDGRAPALPTGTTLQASVGLADDATAPILVQVRDGAFEAAFPAGGAEFLPGLYILTLTLRADGLPPESRGLLAGLEGPDLGTKFFKHRMADAERTAQKIVESAVGFVRAMRLAYDDACQIGARVERSIEAARKEEPRIPGAKATALFAPWKEFRISGSERHLAARREFVDAYVGKGFLCPAGKTVQLTISLSDTIVRLISAYTVTIMRSLGMDSAIPPEDLDRGQFPPKMVIGQVSTIAWTLETRIQTEVPLWEPRIKIGKERGGQDGAKYVSQTSGFSIEVPSEKWRPIQGGEDSTMRYALVLDQNKLMIAAVQVHIVEFPWAEGKQELVDAWVRLAEYEWPQYRHVGGGWVTESPEREYYKFDFKATLGKNTRGTPVTCYLFFPGTPGEEHRVYGLMVVTPYAGIIRHHMEEDFKKMLDSFTLSGR